MAISLQQQLQQFYPSDAHEIAMAQRLEQFLQNTNNPFGRDLAGTSPEWGHITGSAWIISTDRTQCVLLYHRKLGKWVQPGGHCDGEKDVLSVARREATEETGLQVQPFHDAIFDIDIHVIPEYWNTPAHLHFDVRYLFTADPSEPIIICKRESHAARWMTLDEAVQLADEETITRMVRKTREM